MRLSTVTVVLAITYAVQAFFQPDNPYGVGFFLSSSGGTASVYGADDNVFDVVWLPGGADYRHYMELMGICKEWSPNLRSQQHFAEDVCVEGQHFCKDWSVRAKTDNPLVLMLRALKNAVEALVDEPVSSVQLGISHSYEGQQRSGIFWQHCKEAFKELGLDPIAGPHHSGPLVIKALRLEGSCDAPQTIFALDYDFTSLTLALWEERCGSYREIQVVHLVGRGAISLQHCFHDQDVGCTSRLIELIEAFVEARETIHKVVVFGTAMSTPSAGPLHSLLKYVLDFRLRCITPDAFDHPPDVGLTHAAARGAAMINLEKISGARHENIK